MSGEDLLAKVSNDLVASELIDTIKGLMDQGYVDADKSGFYNADELKEVYFRINSGWSKDLRDALHPKQQKKSKRVRRE